MDRRQIAGSIDAQKAAIQEQADALARAERAVAFYKSEGENVSDLEEMLVNLRNLHSIATRRVKAAEDKLAGA